MPVITAVGTALPEHILKQTDVREFASHMFGEAFGGDMERLSSIFSNGEISERHFCVPLEWFATEHTFKEKNDLYIKNGLELSKLAIAEALQESGLDYKEIDYFLFVSTSGVSTPSMDARLIEQLPFRKDIKRVPIWGLGCAGGASSISRAMDITRGNPDARVLIVVMELCGLTFIRNDLSKSALIAASLFGDGAAAIIVQGDNTIRERRPEQPEVLDSQTTSLPDSLNVMGWDIGDAGFKVIISRDIPTIVRTFMRDSIVDFLASRNLTSKDITHYVAHPGGAKVLQAYEESLDLDPDALRHTRDILRTCGNMSAVSVIFVLKEFMRELRTSVVQPAYGVLCALGPGFAAEVLLLRWNP